jgi:pyruvate, orthophosphate dikinase
MDRHWRGGTVASIGVASGAIALDSDAAERMHQAGIPAILVCQDPLTSDIAGMGSAEGILTARGARTSHAAVVARQLGKVCLVACSDLEIDLARRCCRIGARILNEGDVISLDGNEGTVYVGTLEVIKERPERELEIVVSWQVASRPRSFII